MKFDRYTGETRIHNGKIEQKIETWQFNPMWSEYELTHVQWLALQQKLDASTEQRQGEGKES